MRSRGEIETIECVEFKNATTIEGLKRSCLVHERKRGTGERYSQPGHISSSGRKYTMYDIKSKYALEVKKLPLCSTLTSPRLPPDARNDPPKRPYKQGERR